MSKRMIPGVGVVDTSWNTTRPAPKKTAPPDAILIIEDLSSDDPEPAQRCTLAEFASDNGDSLEDPMSDLLVQVMKLAPGGSVEFGGGATPWQRITRAVSK